MNKLEIFGWVLMAIFVIAISVFWIVFYTVIITKITGG